MIQSLTAFVLAIYADVMANPDYYAIASLVCALAVESVAAQADALLRSLARQPGGWSTDELMSFVKTKFLDAPMGRALAGAVLAYFLARFSGDKTTALLALHGVALLAAGYSLPIWRDARAWAAQLLQDLELLVLRQPMPLPT